MEKSPKLQWNNCFYWLKSKIVMKWNQNQTHCLRGREIPERFRKFPSNSGNSRMLPEIPECFRKFPSTSGNSRILTNGSEHSQSFQSLHSNDAQSHSCDSRIFDRLILIKQVLGLQKHILWSHFSTDLYKIGINGKPTTRPISLDMNCRPQY